MAKSKRKTFRLCTNVATALTLALLVCGLYSVWKYSDHDENDWHLTHTELAPALAYFDANRGALPVQSVIAVDADDVNNPCIDDDHLEADGWSTRSVLNNWRGSVDGCLANDDVLTGTCESNNKLGDDFAAKQSLALTRWKGDKQFCVQRVKASTLLKNVETETCNTETEMLCGCHCVEYQGTHEFCPIHEFRVQLGDADTPDGFDDPNTADYTLSATGDAAGDWQLIYSRTENEQNLPAMYRLEVSYYELPCADSNQSPEDPAEHYQLINSQLGTGCGDLGPDDHALEADRQQEWHWYLHNDGMTSPDPDAETAVTLSGWLDQLPQYRTRVNTDEAFQVLLVNRQQITAECTEKCDTFLYENNAADLLTTYDELWGIVRQLGVVSLSTSILASSLLYLFHLETIAKQSQARITVLYTICLMGLFCSCLLLQQLDSTYQDDYLPKHNEYKDITNGKCFKGTWDNVANLWFQHTDLNSLYGQILPTLALFVVLMCGGFIFAVWALMQTSNKRRRKRGSF